MEENKAIAYRVVEEFLNTGNPDVAERIFAAGYFGHNPSNPELSGIENIKKFVADWHAAFRDTHNTIEDVIAEGDKVVLRWTTRGVHREEFLGIPPPGNRVAVASIGLPFLWRRSWRAGTNTTLWACCDSWVLDPYWVTSKTNSRSCSPTLFARTTYLICAKPLRA